MDKTLGQRIRELREERDLSLREFAKKLGGLSAAFLSDIELGRRYPSEEVLTRMANILGETLEELQNYDTRLPIESLKRRTESDPAFGMALRKVVEKKVSAKDLLELAKQADLRKKE